MCARILIGTMVTTLHYSDASVFFDGAAAALIVDQITILEHSS
jgi:hypothetical protein